MNITSARNVSEFVHVLARDGEGRPTRFLVPGHKGRQYEVSFDRNGGLQAWCFRIDDESGDPCKGNAHCTCYHVLASCLVAAEKQGKELSWCESQADAERLARIEGKVFTVKSAQSGKVAYGVVRTPTDSRDKVLQDLSDKAADLVSRMTGESIRLTYRKLADAGLGKDELVRLAIEQTQDKQQWYSGESVRLAPDAYLKNDDGFVRLYRSDKSGKYPKVTRLATVFWLDPGNIEAGWQRYTEAQRAREELFSP
jgi:hypothetical protein